MRLSLWLLFGLYALFSAPACSSADSASGGATLPSLSASGAGGGRSSGSSSDKDGHGASSAFAGADAAAGAVANITWNSAKSAALTDAQLALEYSAWKSAHVEPCSDGSWVVANGDVVDSEGIGYGLLLSVAMADQTLFDGLWQYYQAHLDKNGLMNASTAKCGASASDTGASTDADLDAAMALVQAAARWPSAGYLARAQALSAKIATLESEVCDGRRVLRPGDAVGDCTDASDSRINPSYFSPGYYKVFARYFPDQAATWTALSDGSYQLYALYQARLADLVPDWSNPDGSDDGSSYSYSACRTPFRVAVDYAWTGDTRAKIFLQNIASWVDAHGGLPEAAQAQNSAFVGSFALAGGYDQGKFDAYMASWLGATLDDAPYYQGTLRVVYLLVAAGKFSSTL